MKYGSDFDISREPMPPSQPARPLIELRFNQLLFGAGFPWGLKN
jgi:hypothetical protein